MNQIKEEKTLNAPLDELAPYRNLGPDDVLDAVLMQRVDNTLFDDFGGRATGVGRR